jgi:phospholipase C
MKNVLFLTILLSFLMIGCGAGPMQGPTDTGSTPPAPAPPPTPNDIHAVNHIVLFMQENRSFDHYFAKLNDYRAAHGLGTADVDVMNIPTVSLVTWDGSPNVTPFHMNSMCSLNLSSAWQETHVDIDKNSASSPRNPPPMDGFVFTAGGFCAHSAACWDTAGTRAAGYYTDADLPFYYWGATQFATSDRWFSPNPTRTQPNRTYLLAATSEGHKNPPSPTNPWNLKAKTIFQLLEENHISWKVYVTGGMSPSKPTGDTYMNFYALFTPQHTANFVPATQFATDAANGTLPQVSLIESGYSSENAESHPTDEHPENNVQNGAIYAHDLVAALIGSPSWKDSVFFLTYDEGGGFYDHVPPMATVNPDGITPVDFEPGDIPGDFTITGFRVPLVVFSPFTKKGYVSHTPADFTAMLKFIETRFGLPSLTKRDAMQPDMTEFFDFANSPNLNPGPIEPQPVFGADRCYYDHLP